MGKHVPLGQHQIVTVNAHHGGVVPSELGSEETAARHDHVGGVSLGLILTNSMRWASPGSVPLT